MQTHFFGCFLNSTSTLTFIFVNTGQHGSIEKDNKNNEELKVQYNVNPESFSATEVRDEKCLEEEDTQTNGAQNCELEVSENVEDSLQVADEANVHINKGTGKPETHEKDTETEKEVMSENEACELSNKQKTSHEATENSEPDKQCEKPAGVNDSIEEKVSSEEV